MVLAIILGIVVGVCGALPLLLTGRMAKARRRRGKDLTVSLVLLLVVVSFVFLTAAIGICGVMVAEMLVPFSVAAIAAFLLCMMGFAVARSGMFRTGSRDE